MCSGCFMEVTAMEEEEKGAFWKVSVLPLNGGWLIA